MADIFSRIDRNRLPDHLKTMYDNAKRLSEADFTSLSNNERIQLSGSLTVLGVFEQEKSEAAKRDIDLALDSMESDEKAKTLLLLETIGGTLKDAEQTAPRFNSEAFKYALGKLEASYNPQTMAGLISLIESKDGEGETQEVLAATV